MKTIWLLGLALSAATAVAQDSDTDYSADTKTVESTVKALYDVISGPAGAKRDWARFRNLFAPSARLVPTFKAGKGFEARALTPDDYVAQGGPLLEKEGFFEKELGRRTELYGTIAHVFTAYESRMKSPDEKPFERGVNSVQLTYDGTRWWIQNVIWAGESTAGPLPKGLSGNEG